MLVEQPAVVVVVAVDLGAATMDIGTTVAAVGSATKRVLVSFFDYFYFCVESLEANNFQVPQAGKGSMNMIINMMVNVKIPIMIHRCRHRRSK
jgi:hypothetical protein